MVELIFSLSDIFSFSTDDKSFLVESLGIILNTNIISNSDQATDRQLIQSLISNWKLIQQENISSLERKVIELESDARVRKRENLSASKSETKSTDVVKDELLASETQVDELFRENEVRLDVQQIEYFIKLIECHISVSVFYHNNNKAFDVLLFIYFRSSEKI